MPCFSVGNVHPAGSRSNLLVVIMVNRGEDLDSAGLVSGSAGFFCPGIQEIWFSLPVSYLCCKAKMSICSRRSAAFSSLATTLKTGQL